MSMKKRDEEKQIIFESLKESLLILLNDYQFEKITVSQLVKKAGIARSTFYHYFSDKINLIRFLVQQNLNGFDQKYHPDTIEERYQKKYIREVWYYLLQDKEAVIKLYQAGLSYIYLEEMNKHLLSLYPYRLTTDEKINLLGLAGAQYNIIFNLFVPQYLKDL